MSRRSSVVGLKHLLAPIQVVADPIELITYEMDAAFDRGAPDAVVFPRTTDDVVRIVKWAADHGIPLVARGAGTGLSGGAVAERGGVIVAFSRMNRMLELDEAGRSVVVEPGLVNLVLDELVKTKGLCYPPDPASGRTATIGGNVAENAGGPHCFKYGVTTNYITGLELVLADNRVIHLGGRALDYPEYDLTGVVTGSEGTLGLVTRIEARLLRNVPAIKTLMVSFDSVEEAGVAVSAIIARGLVPTTMELMDRKIMRIIEDYAHAGLPVEDGAALIIEADGYPESVSPQIEEIAADVKEVFDPVNILNPGKVFPEQGSVGAGECGSVGVWERRGAGAEVGRLQYPISNIQLPPKKSPIFSASASPRGRASGFAAAVRSRDCCRRPARCCQRQG
jgi:D-lactate dehydrogenase (cytochrome)